MHLLFQEAIKIAQDLGDVIFIGAVGIFLQTKETRESHDLDFAVAKELSPEFLDSKRYFVRRVGGKEARFTPRGYKVDIYTKDVSGIPIDKVVQTAHTIPVRKGIFLKAASVEVLVVSKFRAAQKRRGTDDTDLRTLAQKKYKDIDWAVLESLADSDIEFQQIKMTVDALSRASLRF